MIITDLRPLNELGQVKVLGEKRRSTKPFLMTNILLKGRVRISMNTSDNRWTHVDLKIASISWPLGKKGSEVGVWESQQVDFDLTWPKPPGWVFGSSFNLSTSRPAEKEGWRGWIWRKRRLTTQFTFLQLFPTSPTNIGASRRGFSSWLYFNPGSFLSPC